MKSLKNWVKTAAVALPLVMAASSAQAVMITSWGWYLTNTWSSATDDNGDPIANDPNGGSPRISWGTDIGNGQSWLEIDRFESGTGFGDAAVITNDFVGVGTINITHHNATIQAPSLATASLTGSLTLDALTPPNPIPDLGPFVKDFDVTFFESPNFDPCLPGSTGAPCDDVFVLSDPGQLSFDFVIPIPGYDDVVYTLQIIVPSLVTLNASECAAAGAAAGCQGFRTHEGEDTTVGFGFRILAREIPEPAVLGLMGLGLLWGARRRQSK
ncbi:MAG: THxN family PEP-CTERM protein [Gammaproteobacteria bacterium]|nr:THxN family PEP-CTERM protein [Gammaproteobacteria bacterium]